MKYILSILMLVIAAPTFATTLKVNALQCSGLGLVNGYTTITLTAPNKLTVSSVKYFITTEDDAVEIANAQIQVNGYVRLDLHSTRFNSDFMLIMSGPVGPAQFSTSSGSDALNCTSNIQAL